MRKVISVAILATAIAAGCSATSGSQPSAKDQINQQAQDNNRKTYVPHNHVELDNYNKRLKVSDDPTTILWCTSAFPVPGSPMFTVPIVGKLTSGSKRPFPMNNMTEVGTSNSTENPDAQGFYGSSGDYRFGFDPTGAYNDFTNIATYCTTEPKVWQKEKTTIVLATDPSLNAAAQQAQAQLKAGDKSGANTTLGNAVTAAGGK